MQPPQFFYFFLLFHIMISFYISKYNFSKIFRISFNISYLKTDFCHKCSFFEQIHSTSPQPQPLNSQNLLSMTKVFVNAPQLRHKAKRLTPNLYFNVPITQRRTKALNKNISVPAIMPFRVFM